MTFVPLSRRSAAGFTSMEVLVIVAVALVIGSFAVPVYSTIQMRGNKAIALENIQKICRAAGTYSTQNNGELPHEDAKGTDTWEAAADPLNRNAWYNALPALAGAKTVGDYASAPEGFYSRQNLLFLPGATYPEDERRLIRPLFALAMNSKLQRKGSEGNRSSIKVSQITTPSRTVLFLEQGLPGEKKALAAQQKYTGSAKGSAQSFVARYSGRGLLGFVDGHVESVSPEDLLLDSGVVPYPQIDVVWTLSPDDNPN